MRWLAWVGLVGCVEAGAEDVAMMAEADADELARATSVPMLGLRGDPLDLAGDVEGFGSCVWDWSIAGPRSGAAFDAGLRFDDCGGAWTGRRGGSIDYAVRTGWLDGTVTEAGDEWRYTITGARDATAVVTTAGGRVSELDGSWTLLSLEGTTRALQLGTFDAELRYEGPYDGVWLLSWSIDEDDAASGTLTGPGGAVCDVGGTRGAVTVTCP